MTLTNNIFQLTFPEGWRETTVHTFEGPHDNGLQHNLVLTIVPGLEKDATLEGFAKNQLVVSTEVLPAFEMLSEGEKQTPAGEKRYEAVYRYSPSDELTYYQKQYFLIRERRGYIFSSTFSKKTLKTIANMVDQIVDSLQTGLGR
jgi:hypothetical protein